MEPIAYLMVGLIIFGFIVMSVLKFGVKPPKGVL